jgi:hypothetical protein
MLDSVKEILTKEVNIKEFLAMEIELKNLKKLLATEIKLKEFLVQEINITSLLSSKEQDEFDSAKAPSQHNQLVAPATHLSLVSQKKMLPPFDYTLIETLHNNHKEILFIFNEMMRFAAAKDYLKVAGRLELFSNRIRQHYHHADVDLYAYLKCHIQQKYPKREKAFTELSLEMKNISIEIFFIFSQSPNIPLNDNNYDGFMSEFTQLGIQMNRRINREECVLFAMYQKTNEATSIS